MSDAYVYIMASREQGVLYVGVTTDINSRVYQHKQGLTKGFTEKYNVKNLVYVESFPDIMQARHREHMLKRWRRQWKIELIEKNNPQWVDLSETLF